MDNETNQKMNNSVITDSVILDKDYFFLIAEKDMGDSYDPWGVLPPVFFFTHIFHGFDKEGEWGWQRFGENHFKYPKAAHTETVGEMLVIGSRGEVWYHGLGDNKQFEKPISKDLVRGVYAIKNIHGTLYVVGTHRAVVRRDGVNEWTLISEEIKNISQKTFDSAKEKGGSFDPGFECIDGFEANTDLYAAGGLGDVWRYDGKDWEAIDIPLTQMHISSICCAADGFVYLAGRFGVLLKGRDDHWKIINQQQTKADFRDLVEYNGKVYVCNEGDLYTIEKDTIKTVDFGEMGKPFSFSALYVNHGLLMASGSFSACIFNGKQWKLLYGSAKVDELLEFNVLTRATDQLEEVIDKLGNAVEAINKQEK